ncbi:hypothetical protein C4K35_1359 [Pseudomonas chlororaphis subsp. piscium]|nr:hypothetical protein C4K35_1359 [Pseudomonas chlororaphis subsp. piscium]AZC55587.1 hypothetical protein C4K34_1405 [Pseudomonas chlororaphis subsp. piscium]AZC61848.1 hypothetical protein C4K33_1339 [Pseudomonas chlororaphis subsp. piscium]AZC68088.1 hypothetical protein C4K32_1409 [Pseudomonas chlororaphis subsp. piscium]AZC74275.1 hypothetical protein C4K31_1355 [Pseudomonas chlororaphis subsp. piscium]
MAAWRPHNNEEANPHEHRPRAQPRPFIPPSPADGLIPQDPFRSEPTSPGWHLFACVFRVE